MEERKETLRQNGAEFLGVLCNLYIVFLLAVLPLYTTGTYVKIGDVKYLLFRNVTLLVVGIWLLMEILILRAEKCSMVDIAMLCYAGCVLISAVCSEFQPLAWTGYGDWYMGALSQLLFVGIYFMVSRHYDHNALSIYLGEVGLLAVTAIAFLNRLGFDPVGLMRPYNGGDWEYSHMLSTLGNINWLCGFYSVAVALPMAGYLYTSKRWKAVLLYMLSVLGLTLLCIQGSDSGPIIAATGVGLCLLFSYQNPERFQKGLFLAVGVLIAFPLMGRLITMFGAQLATPIDGDIYAKMQWQIWWILAAALAMICVFLSRCSMKVQKTVVKSFLGICVLTVVAAGILLIWKWDTVFGAGWGSGRGILWQKAWAGFCEAAPLQKLVGAGPDCFAEALMQLGISPTMDTEDHWQGAIYANAHNEWLTQLVNVGICGALAYLAIFVTGIRRYRGMLLGVLALGMYGVHSLVSFQQVLNTPFLFLVLGLCEAKYRRFEAQSI